MGVPKSMIHPKFSGLSSYSNILPQKLLQNGFSDPDFAVPARPGGTRLCRAKGWDQKAGKLDGKNHFDLPMGGIDPQQNGKYVGNMWEIVTKIGNFF